MRTRRDQPQRHKDSEKSLLRVSVSLWLFIICVLCSLGVLSAQEPFKGGIRTVAVYATVANAEGRLVPDLGRDRFSVFDNGKPAELTLFANDIQPITVVMLIQRSGTMRRQFELVEKAAEEFVNAMLPADKARIGSFADRIQVDPRDFTSDHDALLKILRTELQEPGPAPLWNAVNVGITDLLHQQGRRVVLVFTDGMDNPMNVSSANATLKSVTKRAEEEDVMIYTIGVAGSGPSSEHTESMPGGRRGGHGGGGGRGRGGFGRGGGFGGGRSDRGRAQSSHPDEDLPKIAATTGGGHFELTSSADLAATLQRVADELHHQYALGFTPASLDGKMHALDVKVSGAGLTARARKSYLARAVR
jgi:Ca-activated chloride channel family protein